MLLFKLEINHTTVLNPLTAIAPLMIYQPECLGIRLFFV